MTSDDISGEGLDVTLFAIAVAAGVLVAAGAATLARGEGYNLALGFGGFAEPGAFGRFSAAWWFVSGTGLAGGYAVARLLRRAALGAHAAMARNALIAGVVLAATVLGQSTIGGGGPSVLAGFAASLAGLVVATAMAAAGAWFALRG